MVSIRDAVAAIRPRAARQRILDSGLKARTASWATCAAALAALGFGGFAAAQSTSTAASSGTSSSQQTAQLQEVTVTGSRIKLPATYTSPTPTTVIDSQTMQSMGIVNVGQALNLTPSNVSTFTPTAAPASAFYTGAYIPDLRGLNGFFSSRTLTLIDGQRVVPTNTSDSFDLNFIPQVLVERIDTVTGGASAAYGSGAVAGVVNIILNRQLNGGKLDADIYDTHYNDAREQHVAFAFGHGLFNDRFHFVVGGEYSKQDPAFCMASGRPWCTANYGPYTTSYHVGPAGSSTGLESLGSNIRTNGISETGVLGAAELNPTSYSYASTTPGSPLYQATTDGLNLAPYEGNDALYGGMNSAPGGQGNPANLYTPLLAPVTRGVITALLTTRITDSITMDVDLNWGKVQVNTPDAVDNTTGTVLGLDNAYLPAGASAALDPTNGYYLGKDWNSQIPNSEYSNTTLKRAAVTLNGGIGDSSWTWNGYWEYGLVDNTEGEPTDFHADESSMALDSVVGANGQPECRITQALADNPGNLDGAFQQLLGEAGLFTPGAGAYPAGLFSYPSYLEAVGLSGAAFGTPVPADPLTGLSLLQQEALLAQNCVPLDPFGKQQLTSNAIDYVTGNLSLNLRQTQTVLALNTTGNFWHGIGAGPFSMAVGYEWRQEIVHNQFSDCPPGAMSASAYQLCIAQTTDYTVQFGDPYGGDLTDNEAYLEFNFPLLKNKPWARNLDIDIAGRESSYQNTALYAVGIPSGSSNTVSFPTWKVSLNYTPIEGIRFRATESRDTRAPDPRDLYYSQIFVAGSLFGSCGAFDNPFQSTPCNINLIGNVNLRPESANTTTFGVVFTPPQLPGLEFSADWYHIHLVNGINGGNFGTIEAQCATEGQCTGVTFNPYYYNAAGSPCASGQPAGAPGFPGSSGVACSGSLTTGAAAFQTGGVANIANVNAPAYNGAFYDTRGMDFSLNYVWALPDGSTIAVRSLATWVGEQVYQNYAGGPIYNLAGQTGNNSSLFGLGDYQNDPRWRGNIAITWSKGPWSVTPNLTWIGEGSLNNQGLACSEAALNNSSNPCNWVYNGFAVTGLTPSQTAQEAYMKALGYTILPMGVANRVPAYFLTGLNVTYTFANVLQGLQLYTQVDNLFNKAPPMAASSATTGGGFGGTAYTTNPVFFDTLGQAFRVGFRLKF
jgi:iron complex outermembrane recepter protein